MGYPVQLPMQNKLVVLRIADINTAGSHWVHPGFRGKIKRISLVTDAATTSDPTGFTVEIGGTAVTGAVLTVAVSGSGAGVVYTANPSALNSFTEDQPIEVITDGVGSSTVVGHVTLELEPT